MTKRQVGIDAHTAGGAALVIAGGLVAAVTGPLDLAKGSWLAAYLVLVGGVALIAIGIAQQNLPTPVPAPIQIVQLGGWAVANAVVIVGALLSSSATINVGAILLLLVLALTWWVGHGLIRLRNLLGYAYLAVLAILIVSAPIGMALGAR
ncbi:MAG: hypothetical protein WBA05_12310 [Gordonia sp. (in: high G+C Gram-positive bacteria)]|uniref:hypothetical protein n=1 Tax=Gordonia TaxID=2053 RepID=UPI003262F656